MKAFNTRCFIALTTTMPFISMGLAGAAPITTDVQTTYPISNVVVIFQENVSFDHYFATYPNALNLPNERTFNAKPGTPTVNGLTQALLTNNPNSLSPHRLSAAQAATADQSHEYMAEQQAFDHGLMDKFVQFTGSPENGGPSFVMNYFDGNTVTALWNYAQNFAMSDNFFGTVTGPSTPGALNLIAGQTHGASPDITDTVFMGTDISDADPTGDTASGTPTFSMTGKNVGDLLNAKGLTWGFFEGGFANPSQVHIGADGNPKADYIPHHEPFQYYPQTANPTHKPPSSVQMIGYTDQANHQYDITNFWQALDAHNLPAVSYLKAPAYQDGHAGYSSPVFEQPFLVETINRLMKSRYWSHLAIIICYDDSDGWYDHVMPPNVNQSQTPYDVFTGNGQSGTNPPLGGFQGRFGYGPRLPLLVISPFAKQNFVDHSLTDQSSILRFIEDNWGLGQLGNGSFDALAGSLVNLFDFSTTTPAAKLILNPNTGQPSN
jgi:phospholipase C